MRVPSRHLLLLSSVLASCVGIESPLDRSCVTSEDCLDNRVCVQGSCTGSGTRLEPTPVSTEPPGTVLLSEDFEASPLGGWNASDTASKWTPVEAMTGVWRVVTDTSRVLEGLSTPGTAPMTPNSGALTVSGRSFAPDLQLSARLRLSEDLSGDSGHPGRLALLFAHDDTRHGLSFGYDGDGWALRKRHPWLEGGEGTLASGRWSETMLGRWTDVRIVQQGNRIEGFIDGRKLFSVVEAASPGRVGLAAVNVRGSFDQLKVEQL